MDDLAKRFQFPINGYVLFSGHGHLIAAFNDHRDAMKVQQLMAREHKGNHYTIIWCDGYHTMVCDREEPETACNEEQHNET